MFKDGQQPKPGGINPDNPPKGGSGLNNRVVTVEMNAGGNYLRMMSLIVKVESIKAEIEGMKACNRQRRITGNSLGYDDEAFFRLSQELNFISKEIMGIYEGVKECTTQDKT